jgi:hypothetical protein
MSRHEGGIPGKAQTALGFKHLDDRETGGHQRRLGVFGQGKLAFRPFEHQARQVLRQGIVDFCHYPPRRYERGSQGLPHADDLRSLTGKYKRALHPECAPPIRSHPGSGRGGPRGHSGATVCVKRVMVP